MSDMKRASPGEYSLKASSPGADSQGGNMLPWSFDERRRMVFSPVGSSRDCWGGRLDSSPGDLRPSAREMSSSHLRFSRARSAALGASVAAFM